MLVNSTTLVNSTKWNKLYRTRNQTQDPCNSITMNLYHRVTTVDIHNPYSLHYIHSQKSPNYMWINSSYTCTTTHVKSLTARGGCDLLWEGPGSAGGYGAGDQEVMVIAGRARYHRIVHSLSLRNILGRTHVWKNNTTHKTIN